MVLVPGRICREDICLLNDFAFKYHVMQDCEVSKYILKILLNEEIQDIEILDKERLGRVQLSKTYYADYVAYVNQDTDLHMEMQNRREDFDIDRILHYLARLIDKDMMKGEGYHGNRKIVIWFHNYVMPENQGLVKDYNILDSPHYIVKLVNLSRLKKILEKPVEDMSSLERLCIYLRYSHVPKHRALIEKLRKEEKGINEMEKNIQSTLQHPMEYFECRDIHVYFKRRKELKELEQEKKKLAKEQQLRKDEIRKREEEQRLRMEESRKREEEQQLRMEESRKREEEQRLRLEEIHKRELEEIRRKDAERRCEELENMLKGLQERA